MQRFRRVRSIQKFVTVLSFVHNHFNQERYLYSRDNFKLNRAAALAEWLGLGSALRKVILSLLRPVRIGLMPNFSPKVAPFKKRWRSGFFGFDRLDQDPDRC
jgi:putative transposase